DTEITGDLRKEFLQWIQDLKILEDIHISRWINVTLENLKQCTINTFCDASKEPYAAVLFLILEEECSVNLSLLAAKFRKAPLRGGAIARMELLATLVGESIQQDHCSSKEIGKFGCYSSPALLSIEAFLMGFRRFIDKRGRCSTIYCDNGINFIGTSNLLYALDWNKIVRHGAVNAINWKFNPPTAAWWDGWRTDSNNEGPLEQNLRSSTVNS
ncbi:uncharacterized protein NPIL_161141, partial [Nephila pilipes]